MAEKRPCEECGAMILLSTAARTGGLCIPCYRGTRPREGAANGLDSAGGPYYAPTMGEPSCAVQGSIVAKGTGRPLARISVHAQPIEGEGGMQWMAFSDDGGRYWLPLELPGSRTLEFEGDGVEETRTLTIGKGDIVTLDVEIDPAGPPDPPYDLMEGEFAGYFSHGFGKSDFVPHYRCVVDTRGEIRRVLAAWVVFANPQLQHSFGCGSFEVRWRGTLTGPRSFGPLGDRKYLMTVQEILASTPLDSRDGVGPTPG